MSVAAPVIRDLEILSGTTCFGGTRVPVKSLFDALERGRSLEYFLEQFPAVSQDQARRVLQQAELLIEQQTPVLPSVSIIEMKDESDAIARTIEQAQSILKLLDENDKPLVHPAALERATKFLRNCSTAARISYRQLMGIPAIQPGPELSVDLHWKASASETLVNVPAESAAPITFYGDDTFGNTIKGSLVSENFGGLVLWLTTKN